MDFISFSEVCSPQEQYPSGKKPKNFPLKNQTQQQQQQVKETLIFHL